MLVGIFALMPFYALYLTGEIVVHRFPAQAGASAGDADAGRWHVPRFLGSGARQREADR
jgi:hypothetical protein